MSDPSVQLPRSTRLVSFLGIGDYKPTRHRFPDGTEGTETPYICRSLAGFAHADEIAILATNQARAKHGESITAELRATNLPAPTFHEIPIGENEAELWRQFEVVKELLRPSEITEIAFDVTHAFRSQPFFAAAITSFVRAVDPKPANIKVFYAAFEASRDGMTPVWELTPFIDLLDWAQQIMLFLRTGRSAGVADRTEALGRDLARSWAAKKEGERPRLDRLGKVLRDFGGNLETMRTGDLLLPKFPGSVYELEEAVEQARASATSVPPLADVLDRLRQEMIEPLLGASAHLVSDAGHRALAGLARLYLDMGRWAEAAATVREGWITRYATPAAAFAERNQQRPSVDRQEREVAEIRWNEDERDAARRIAKIRNDIEHAGFNRQPASAANLQRGLRKLVDEFSELPGLAAPAQSGDHAPVFINLSNHPSDRWSAAQREAALQFAPMIHDVCFPAVPPEADSAQIGELVESIVEQLTGNYPGATHAMVQGEFTLVHALVHRLQQSGIACLSATTRRDVSEEGDVKITRFEFVRFREYL